MAKESKSARIRALLAEGVQPKDIAKKLRVAASYVHTVKWQWQHGKSKGKKTAAAPPANAAPQPITEVSFIPVSKYVAFEHSLVDMIDARVRVLLQKVLS